MDNFTKKVSSRISSTVQFDTKHQEALKEDGNYQKIISPIKSADQQLNILIPISQETLKVDTQKKKDSRQKAEENACEIVDFLKSHGVVSGFLPFKKLEGYAPSNISKYSATDFKAKVGFLLMLTDDHPRDTANAGVSPELLQSLKDNFVAYQEIIDAPQKHRKRIKNTNSKIKTICENSQERIDDALIPYMRARYGKSNTKLFLTFMNAVSVDAIPRRKRALQGLILDDTTGKPLQNVTLHIDDNKPITRGGKKGHYFIQSLEPGEHKLRFELKGFKSFTARIVIIEGQTYKLNVRMANVLEGVAVV